MDRSPCDTEGFYMSTKSSIKQNRFLIFTLVIALVMTTVVVISARNIFGSLNKASELDQSLLESNQPRINKVQLDKAIEFIEGRQFTPLDLR